MATDIEISPLALKFLPPSLVINVAKVIKTPTASTPLSKLSESKDANAFTAKARMPIAIPNATIDAPKDLNLLTSESFISLDMVVITAVSSPISALIPSSATPILPGSIVDKTNIDAARIAIAFAILIRISALIDSCMALNGPVIVFAKSDNDFPIFSPSPPIFLMKSKKPLMPSAGASRPPAIFLSPIITVAAEPALNRLMRLLGSAFLSDPNRSPRSFPADFSKNNAPDPKTLPIAARPLPTEDSTLVTF